MILYSIQSNCNSVLILICSGSCETKSLFSILFCLLFVFVTSFQKFSGVSDN